MTTLERFAAVIAEAGIASSFGTREILKRHVADIAGAWIAARATPEGRAVENFSLDEGMLDRVARHCALVRLSEIDDIHLASLTTPGAAVVPTALTLAAEWKADRDDLADAMVAGYEAMVRLGLALGGANILYRGIWVSYFTAPFATAAVAARLLKLTPTQTAHALALALNLSAPSVGHHHGPMTSRWLAFGMMARNGAAAALAARSGFVGDLAIFEGQFFPSVYNLTPDPAMLTGDPVMGEISFKPWCAARQTMAAAQALSEILAREISANQISAVSVAIPTPQVKMVDHGVTPGDRTSFLTSLPYQLGLTAFAPERRLDISQTLPTVPENIRAFMAKVKIHGQDGLPFYPLRWPARVTVHCGGVSHEHLVTDIPGDPSRPFDDEAVANKFQKLALPVIGPVKANAALDCVHAILSTQDSARTLLDAIMAPS